jgi:hypothetical protein
MASAVMNTDVIKRDGSLQAFSKDKIVGVLKKAFVSHGVDSLVSEAAISVLADEVIENLDTYFEKPCHVENVQDQVENVLLSNGYFDVAKNYIIYREERRVLRDSVGAFPKNVGVVNTPWGPRGEILFALGFGTKETMESITDRVLRACQDKLGTGFTMDELAEGKRMLLGLKCAVSPRLMRWASAGAHGSPPIDRAVVQLSGADDAVSAFRAMLHGADVTVVLGEENVAEWPAIEAGGVVASVPMESADLVVTDTDVGWCELLDKALNACIRGKSMNFNSALVRRGGNDLVSGLDRVVGVFSGAQRLTEDGLHELVVALAAIARHASPCLTVIRGVGGQTGRRDCITLHDRRVSSGDGFCERGGVADATKVLTSKGFFSAEDLCGRDFDTYISGGQVGRKAAMRAADERPVIEMRLANGMAICGTDDVMVKDVSGEWIPLRELNVGVTEVMVDTARAPVDQQSTWAVHRSLESAIVTPDGDLHLPSAGTELSMILAAFGLACEPSRDKGGIVIRNGAACRAKKAPSSSVVEGIRVCPPRKVFSVASEVWANGMHVKNSRPRYTMAMAEVFLPNIETEAELTKVVGFLYRVAKGSSMEVGICISGYRQSGAEKRSWLLGAKRALDRANETAGRKGMRTTALRVHGSLAAVAGFTSGTYDHPVPGGIYVRSNSDIVGMCLRAGGTVEYATCADGSTDIHHSVCKVPWSAPDRRNVAEQVSDGIALMHTWAGEEDGIEISASEGEIDSAMKKELSDVGRVRWLRVKK